MSTVLQPATSGKVVLKTTVGDIDVELWPKEAPIACRNFVQLCMEGYYDNCIFHRIIRKVCAQTGDPTGSGDGGESAYGSPFDSEPHSRLRFMHRGLVAMAGTGKESNGSQFFFTLAETRWLDGKHTIFGKVSFTVMDFILCAEHSLSDCHRCFGVSTRLAGHG
jgi:peptidyl-prolyl cis-trans isomerase SDCCAG10